MDIQKQNQGAIDYLSRRCPDINARVARPTISTDVSYQPISLKNGNAALNYDETCRAIGVNKNRLVAMIRDGLFPPHTYMTKNGKKHWKVKVVRDWIEQNQSE